MYFRLTETAGDTDMETKGITEQGFQLQMQKYYEGLFTQGSGYMSVRGSLEEGLSSARQDEEYLRLPANVTLEKGRDTLSKWGTYIPGIVGMHPALREEMINLPYFWDFRFWFDGEKLDMEQCHIDSYIRKLDFRTGELERSFVWNTRSGAVLRMHYNRVIDFSAERTALQKISVEVERGNGSLRAEAGIDGNVRTNGFDHFKEVSTMTFEDGEIGMDVQTDQDTVRIRTLVSSSMRKMDALSESNRKIARAGSWELQQGSSISFEKVTTVGTSRDLVPVDLLRLLRETASDPEKAWQAGRSSWEQKWETAFVQVEGNDKLQQALNFSVYHLLRCNNRNDGRVGICAKGHAGEAYFGRCFWDTEICMLPFYIYTDPVAAKNLLMFRYNTLKGAKKNARDYGYTGARYAWESSTGGEEQCAAWNYCDHEIHITADVVYALMHYYRAAGDETFMQDYGIDIMVETSRYWKDRVYQTSSDQYVLNGVMGPDEYLMLVNNDAYTNALVQYALKSTADYLKKLRTDYPGVYRRCEARLGILPEEIKEFADIAGKLKQQVDAELVMQCDHFNEFENIDFEKVWKDRTKPFGAFVSQEKNYRSKALKQASVLQLMFEMPWLFKKEQIEKAYDYYLPLTTHDSSLSAGIHAVMAARLNRKEDCLYFLNKAIGVDLDPELKGAEEGIHIANCGNLWQFAVYGLAGMGNIMESEQLEFQPDLPENIKSISFVIACKGEKHKIEIGGNL